MKKTILAALASIYLFMGATCSSTDIAALIAKVQETTATTCAYVPTAQTIIDIFQKGNPQLQSALDIATAICSVMKPTPTASAPHSEVVVNGVVVHGYFVK